MDMKVKTSSIILAGGNSSRMGKDKALLTIGGITTLEMIIKTALEVSNKVVVMRGVKQFKPTFFIRNREYVKIGFDKIPNQGPLQGIADGLDLIDKDMSQIFILTCDIPNINKSWLNNLFTALTKGIDVVCTKNQNYENPLLAIYKKKVLLGARKLLKNNIRRPIELWKGWKVKKLSTNPRNNMFVLGMNTPLEYNKIKKIYKKNNSLNS